MNLLNTIIDLFNDKSAQSSFNPSDVQNNKIVATIPYICPILFFLPILTDKNSAFCRFHANQQLTWFIALLLIGVVVGIISIIPILGGIISFLIGLVTFAIAICFAVGAYQGKAMRLPYIGSMLDIF